MRLEFHTRVGAEEATILPASGLDVVLRVLPDLEGARRRATKATRIDPAFGEAVERRLSADAAKAAAASPAGKAAAESRAAAEKRLKAGDSAARVLLEQAVDAAQQAVDLEVARGRARLLRNDPEAHEALEGLAQWRLAMVVEVAAEALVEMPALADEGASTWRPSSPAEAAERLVLIKPPEVQALVLGELYGAVRKLSEAGTLGKAHAALPSGSITSSDGTPGAAAAPTAQGNG